MTTAATSSRRQLGTALSLGEWAVTADRDAVLTCVGLGSCIGIVMFDPIARVGAMGHMVLPDSSAARSAPVGAKFVDIAVPLLLGALSAAGAETRRLKIYLAGGAQVLQSAGGNTLNIGERNAEAAHQRLAALGLTVTGEDLGGSKGRTMRLTLATGRVTVAASGSAESEL
ncbi:MAG: chemotaxis protein CheD [Dehalococcoidia bacterium]